MEESTTHGAGYPCGRSSVFLGRDALGESEDGWEVILCPFQT